LFQACNSMRSASSHEFVAQAVTSTCHIMEAVQNLVTLMISESLMGPLTFDL
jgi:hypothetical protein